MTNPGQIDSLKLEGICCPIDLGHDINVVVLDVADNGNKVVADEGGGET
jgi:hypothetical protein